MKAHPYWLQGLVRIHHLRQNMLASADKPWQEFLLLVGDGKLQIQTKLSPFSIQLPIEIAAPADWSQKELIVDVFANMAAEAKRCLANGGLPESLQYFCERAILTPKNVVAESLNAEILQSIDPSTHVTYPSVDTIDAETEQDNMLWPIDFLNNLIPSGMPPHSLVLAPGALIMLLRNIDVDAGLCNGVRGLVMQALPKVLDVLMVSGGSCWTTCVYSTHDPRAQESRFAVPAPETPIPC